MIPEPTIESLAGDLRALAIGCALVALGVLIYMRTNDHAMRGQDRLNAFVLRSLDAHSAILIELRNRKMDDD